jgi:hypothetical protein
VDLDEVADELYGLSPDDFTSQRDRLAREARSSDRGLAEEIHKLRRPSLSAWAVNMFVRDRSDELDRLLELGDELRRAQASVAGDELRELLGQRRQIVSAMLGEIRRLARERGQPLSDQLATEVHQTLEAALADAGSAELVRAGRLTKALSHVGLGGGAGEPARAPARTASEAGGEGHRARRDDAAERARERARERRSAAESEAEHAEAELARARGALAAARRDAEQADEDQRRRGERVESLERELEAARAALSAARRAQRETLARLESAERDCDGAARRAEDARRALDALTSS